MIALDMRVDDAIGSRSDGRFQITLGGVEIGDDEPFKQMSAVLKSVTSKKVRILILEQGEEFPEMPKARKPHTGEGSDPFA